jgi:phosphorylase/glycogen(starch) synthase
MSKDNLIPDYLFEVSWEVCNKVGGIYTVLATKALYLKAQRKRRHILIGPDVWMNTDTNPDFIEDPKLYRSWREKAASQGLRLRIGLWNVPGKPVAILVDYKQFLTDTDKLLGKLWETYKVDSIYGDWDYKENVLFGWVAGKVIESFCKFYVEPSDKVVAQFHEWQTGSGVLYLKTTGLPIATVLTTHATVLGRSLAGNNQPLYDNIDKFVPDEAAKQFGVVARHSMEKTAAANADVFTTVSEITARECEYFLGRKVDVVTPNGFENSITPSTDEEFDEGRREARESLRKVASAMSGTDVPEDAVFMGISGRYEFRNKGIDVFIDSLATLAESGYDGKEIHAFIMIPSGHNGPDKRLLAKLEGKGEEDYTTQVSHVLMSPENDTITHRFQETGLVNAPESKVKIYFIPSYLNGNDGIFNMRYYHILIGLDLAVFPSYYEPWGYTPLEACAFGVPTLTTTLAGFGMWVKTHYKGEHHGVEVIERNDSNYEEAVNAVADRIREIAYLNDDEKKAYSDNARDVASIALWKNQIQYYRDAYNMALEKVASERGSFDKAENDKTMSYEKIQINEPSWKSVMITRHLPEEISGLEKLAKNLWWCWNESAKALFKMIDPGVWHKTGHNPMAVLDTVSIKRFNELAHDAEFTMALARVMKEFDTYMAEKSKRTAPQIAYFCMEYGLDASLSIYSGGLGILAGDYLKETSDMNVNLVAVGILYRFGYFTQVLSQTGDQISRYDAQDFSRIPASPVYDKDGNWITVAVAFPGRNVTARVWKVAVGRTDLYLLDTDFEANTQEDREITYHLYGGDWENRLKQELLLGIGGIRALRALGINAQIYHCNEGHAAFTGLERLREYVENDNLSFPEALEVVRASSLFTTHTPVPAGHDAFEENLIRKYIGHYPERLKIDWNTFIGLGKINPDDPNEKFSMSTLAANCSQNVNGVSWLHGKVSQELFSPMYPGYLPEELYISSVTNGVHYPTWTAREWKAVHAKVFGPEFQTHHYDKKCFEGIYKISDEEVWKVRQSLKKTLIDVVNEKLADPALGNHYSPAEIVTIKETLSPDKLTIGFARRFATYKRGTLIFSDLDRLDAIVNDPERPVQFIFAGKAHPADKAGQDLIKTIVEISKDPRFLGKIVFVPGYDITLAKRLVQGVDVWMNNPTRPQEASGTSGEKASMNGVMHFSVLDGWWVEGYKKDAGWALPQERIYDDQNYQNELDAATMYTIIENEIAPAYYDTDPDNGRSATWIGYIKNTIAQVACNFTTNRMLTDYCEKYYFPQAKRAASLIADDYKVAREIAAWKKMVRQEWNSISVVSFTPLDSTYNVSPDNMMESEVVLDLGVLKPEDIGVEMLFTTMDAKGKMHIADSAEFKVKSFENGIATYHASVLPEKTGMYQVATRMYAKNPLLPHRQDFGLVRWL